MTKEIEDRIKECYPIADRKTFASDYSYENHVRDINGLRQAVMYGVHLIAQHPMRKKWAERLAVMKETRASEYDNAPDREIYLLDQMIANTAEMIRDFTGLEQPAQPGVSDAVEEGLTAEQIKAIEDMADRTFELCKMEENLLRDAYPLIASFRLRAPAKDLSFTKRAVEQWLKDYQSFIQFNKVNNGLRWPQKV